MPKRRVKRQSVTQPEDKSIRYIPLTQGQVAVVDAADYEWLSKFHWYAWRDKKRNKGFYARRFQYKATKVRMHREILGCVGTEQGDHINGNTLDNRRCNLRKVTHRQNNLNRRLQRQNKSGFKGVHFHKQRSRWCAMIQTKGHQQYLGLFDSAEDAARAYDAAAKKLHGEFAHLNFSA